MTSSRRGPEKGIIAHSQKSPLNGNGPEKGIIAHSQKSPPGGKKEATRVTWFPPALTSRRSRGSSRGFLAPGGIFFPGGFSTRGEW